VGLTCRQPGFPGHKRVTTVPLASREEKGRAVKERKKRGIAGPWLLGVEELVEVALLPAVLLERVVALGRSILACLWRLCGEA